MLRIASIKINNELRTAQNLAFLSSCIGEKVKLEFEYYYEDIKFCTESVKIYGVPDRSIVDLFDSAGIFYSNTPIFADFNVGDYIGFYHTSIYQVFQVTEKLNDNTLRTTCSSGAFELDKDVDYIFNATPMGAVKYYYNLIESGNSYVSKIDSQLQEYTCASFDCNVTTPKTMVATGYKSWQIGSVKVAGVGGYGGTGSYYVQQRFKITHETVITPFFLESQWTDLLIQKSPSYYEAGKTLNYVHKCQLLKSVYDLTGIQESESIEKSNIGWFNETFNGFPTNYLISSVRLYKSGSPITQLEFGSDIDIEIDIENTTDTPFSNLNTKYIFGYNYLPEDASLYQNNGFNQTRNFLFDSKLNTVGSAAANGDNYGTDLQVIKTTNADFVSTSKITVKATINFGHDAENIMTQGDFYRYMFWVIVENHSLSASLVDKVNLLASVNEVNYSLLSTNLITAQDASIIPHPYEDKSYAQSTYDYTLFPVDDIVMYFPFNIDFSTIDSAAGTKILSVRNKLVLRDTSAIEADILLESFSIDTSSYPIVGGKAQNINFSQDRIFKIPDSIRKKVTLNRDFSSDTTDIKYFEHYYAMMMRWEYWQALEGLTSIPSDVFDSAEPLDGINHFWYRFSQIAGWRIYYDVTFIIEQYGERFEQTFSTFLEKHETYDGNPQWGTDTIKTYDIDTGLELTSGLSKYVLGFKDIKVVVEFEKILGLLPDISVVTIVLWIETYEKGGEADIRQISSKYVIGSDSWFYSIDGSNKLKITRTGNIYKGECYLKASLLPINEKFTMYARIYHTDDSISSNKLFQDGEEFLFQDGNAYEFQL